MGSIFIRFEILSICVFSAQPLIDMKVSNKKSIEKLGLFLMFMVALDMALISMQWLIVRQPDTFIIILLILFIVLVIYLSKLQYTEFENSGFVLTIKKKHLLDGKGFTIPILELPVELLIELQLKKNKMYLSVRSIKPNSDKIQVLKINLRGFNKEQQKILLRLIQNNNILT